MNNTNDRMLAARSLYSDQQMKQQQQQTIEMSPTIVSVNRKCVVSRF